MDFGLLHELGVPRPWSADSERRAYWDSIEQVIDAETHRFTHAWAVEHHFREQFSHMGAPEIWLATVPEHARSIRIGHAVALRPTGFNHPVRLAERAAALDLLSGGRLELGTGRSV